MENIKNDVIEDIKEKLPKMNTSLNKVSFLENTLREKSYSFETKRFILTELIELYKSMKMYQKAAKMTSNKATIEITKRNKVNTYLDAAELYSKLGDIENAELMFSNASREATPDLKVGVILAKKNIYTQFADQSEKAGRKASAVKFYEHLIRMDIDEGEKNEMKEKLKKYYNALGMFREAKLLK